MSTSFNDSSKQSYDSEINEFRNTEIEERVMPLKIKLDVPESPYSDQKIATDLAKVLGLRTERHSNTICHNTQVSTSDSVSTDSESDYSDNHKVYKIKPVSDSSMNPPEDCQVIVKSDVNIDNSVDTSDGSNELIDVTPAQTVTQITNQVVSGRDEDIEHIMKFRDSSKNIKPVMVRSKRFRNPHGYLKVVIGPMYSGKSSELRTDRNDLQSIKGLKILVINYSKDKRYTDEAMVMTHNREGVKCISVEHLAEITNGECYDSDNNVVVPQDYDVILVDEGQFYDDLKDNVVHWVDILRKTVFVYGLDGDFRRQKFGQMMDLIPICDKVIKKKANCIMCNNGTTALFTWRINDNSDKAETVEIGAAEKYVTLCRKHYNRVNKPKVIITGHLYSKN